jgi:hypothetical protein
LNLSVLPAFCFNLTRIDKMGKEAARVAEYIRTHIASISELVSRELYPDGLPVGTTFSDLETAVSAVGDELVRQVIEKQVRAQAEVGGASRPECCPTCSTRFVRAPDQPREVLTTRGKVSWREARAKCTRCRRAFSPSGSSVGT